jgi:hypothetical protein
MDPYIALGVGAVVAGASGTLGCKVLLPKMDQTRIPEGWDGLMDAPEGVAAQGMVESLIFFASFWMAAGWPLAAGWLVFKAAARWESWKSVAEVPRPQREFTISEPAQKDGTRSVSRADSESLAEFKARSYRSAYLHRRFVLGTGINVLAGLLGAGVAHLLAPGGLAV